MGVFAMKMFVLRFLLMLIDEFDLFSKLIDGQDWVNQSGLSIEKIDGAVPDFVGVIGVDGELFVRDVWGVFGAESSISMIESRSESGFKKTMPCMIILIVVLTIVFLSCASYFTLF